MDQSNQLHVSKSGNEVEVYRFCPLGHPQTVAKLYTPLDHESASPVARRFDDALLLRAAPDMLEALKASYPLLTIEFGRNSAICRQVKRAIEKAGTL